MSRSRRVLSVGSEEVALAAFLRKHGYELRTTSNDDAHDFVKTWRPHVVLVDPDHFENVGEFVDRARWSPAVLAVACSERPHDTERLVIFDVCVVKPIIPRELHAILAAWPSRTKSTNAPRS